MTAPHRPSPATATDEPPAPCPMEATAQSSPAAGSGAANSRNRVAAVSRHMRDPYTPGIMFPSAAVHAEGEPIRLMEGHSAIRVCARRRLSGLPLNTRALVCRT